MSTRRELGGKRNKTDETTNTTVDDMSISQLAQWISSKLDSTKEEIAKQINDGMQNVKTEIKAELDHMRSQLEKSIEDLSSSVKSNKEGIHSTAAALSRSLNSNDLIVSGVPFTRDENLIDYFGTWCKHLGFTAAPLVDVRRLSKQPMVVGKNYKILLQFAITNQRSDFYIKYLRTRSFTLDQIGFKSNERIFVNENLTINARGIKAKALLARKDGKLHSVYSRNGEIFIKVTAGGEAISIPSENHLMDILQQT